MATDTRSSLVRADAPPDRATRHRDADETRARLLSAARLRFARDGYAAATVRDIATDAGVNVALINRYFVSKAGLFEACLDLTVRQLGESDRGASSVDQMTQAIIAQIVDSPHGDRPLQLLLLLRSTGDPEVDELRSATLRSFSDRMATAAGWSAEDAKTGNLTLRAELVLAAALGTMLLRSATTLEPLGSATSEDLRGPLGELLDALLSPPRA